MNLLAHYFLDRHRADDSHFFLGVITPDLVGIFDRRVRLKPRTMPLLMENDARPEEVAFYNGIMRHFEADAVFHSSHFFVEENKSLANTLREEFSEEELPRSYFLAHILVELLLDRVLIDAYPEILDEFYGHIARVPLPQQTRLTEWVCKQKLPRYQPYLRRFAERQYLYDYRDWPHILFVLRRILERIHLPAASAFQDPGLLKLLRSYEHSLSSRWRDLFAEMEESLVPLA